MIVYVTEISNRYEGISSYHIFTTKEKAIENAKEYVKNYWEDCTINSSFDDHPQASEVASFANQWDDFVTVTRVEIE